MPTVTTFNVTKENKEEIKALIKRARENVISYEELVKARDENKPPVGDNPENRVNLGTYKVVFTLEECAKDKVFKHISISCQSIIDAKVVLPPVIVAGMILKMFGFKNADNMTSLSDIDKDDIFGVWTEAVGDGIEAINIVELDSVGVEPNLNQGVDLVLGLGKD